MRVPRRKQVSGQAGPGQLDLFSGPTLGALAPVTSCGPARPGVVVQDAGSVSQRPTSTDPLIDYVLEQARGRGRPSKPLKIALASITDQRRLLDVREAALLLGLSKSTLDKMRCSGRGPRFIRATDRAIRYDPADLHAFATERRRQSTSQSAEAAVKA